MKDCTQYQKEVTTALFGDRDIVVEHLVPILTPEQRHKRKREIEAQLFDVFRKYENA